MIQNVQQTPKKDSNNSNNKSSATKTQLQIKREKKKKLSAFKSFLDNGSESVEMGDSQQRKKLSASIAFEERMEPFNSCKICKQYLTNQSKACQFCKDTVCVGHLRKRRRNPKTNKWTKICDYCQDRCLMQKHCQSQIKTQESLISEELVVERRQMEMKEILSKRRAQLQTAQYKAIQLSTAYTHQIARMKALQAQLNAKIRDIQEGLKQNQNLELIVADLQKSVPASLEQDFEYLESESYRITRDLVKYEKLCNDLIGVRRKKEKDMYREYYQWQSKKMEELQETPSESSECNII